MVALKGGQVRTKVRLPIAIYRAISHSPESGAAGDWWWSGNRGGVYMKEPVRKHSERDEPLGQTADWVDVFESGIHRDHEYTPADVKSMAANFSKLSTGEKPVLRVPAVVGHGEDQQFLNDSGWPAAGWPYKVRMVPGATKGAVKLQAKIGEIPPTLAKAINNKSYRKVSAEVYDDFVHPVTGEHCGPTLRRVALLGGEIPQVKTLDDLPKVGYKEQGTFRVFMEMREPVRVCKMRKHKEKPVRKHQDATNPDPSDPATKPAPLPGAEKKDLQNWLQEKGMASQTLESLPDETLAEMVRVMSTEEANAVKEQQMGNQGDPPPRPAPATEAGETMDSDLDSPMDELSGVHPGDAPGREETRPVSGPSGIQPDALASDLELDPDEMADMDPSSPMGMDSDMPSDMDSDPYPPEVYDDDEMMGKKMRQMAHMHREAARRYSAKYAACRNNAEKRKFKDSARFHREMASKYDDNRQFPTRETPKPAAAPNQARPAGLSERKMSERRIAKIVQATVSKFTEPLRRVLRTQQAAQEQAAARSRKQEVRQFCEKMVSEGRLLPALRKSTQRVLLLADDQTVQKFREDDKTISITPMRLMMREISRQPVFRFGERFRDPQRAASKMSETVQKFEAFWERHGTELEAAGETYQSWKDTLEKASPEEAERLLAVG